MTATGAGWVVLTENGPVFGPDTLDDATRERLAAGEGAVFRMGETVPARRSGRRTLVYDTGRYLGPADGRFAPPIEHGFPWTGALWIEYATPAGGWTRPAGLWLCTAWWRTLRQHRGYRATRLTPAPVLLSGHRG
ncbi:hypothetical protein [Amycolatopsis sp. NPDC051903]|uniref:hypothetical protein n=1 Tax=Amycolatopsis sp. NPDC051903 TaxID=3363936 RepID=UPI00379FB03B